MLLQNGFVFRKVKGMKGTALVFKSVSQICVGTVYLNSRHLSSALIIRLTFKFGTLKSFLKHSPQSYNLLENMDIAFFAFEVF